VPGTGYITENTYRPVKQASTSWIGRASPSAQSCRMNELLFPLYRKSFRSGSAYDRLAGKPDSEVHISETSLLENLLAFSGMDTGHEYEIKSTTDIKSDFRRIQGSDPYVYARIRPKTFMIPDGPSVPNAAVIFDYINFGSGSVTDATLIAQGSRCIAAANPLKPPLTLATSLVELLSEGLPSLVGKQIFKSTGPKKRELIKAAGGEYLNGIFGITPIVSDILGLAKVIRNADTIIREWQRNEGRQVRRSRTWDAPLVRNRFDTAISSPVGFDYTSIVPTAATKVAQVYSSSDNTHGGHNGYIESYAQEETKFSFAGAFEYNLEALLPDYPEPLQSWIFGNISDKDLIEQTLNQRLLGFDPKSASSLDTWWNATAFTWLLDWFVNVGDLVSNITAFQQQGLQLDYGYMSVKQVRKFTASWRLTYNASVYDATISITGERKRRIRATPYGFGLTFQGLSPTKSAILASLATSKIR
jgi:hypothetical protein